MAQFNYNGLSKSSGLYIIFNNHNWRTYIGSCKRFKTRWNTGHFSSLKNNKHQNKFLQADFNKCKQELGHDDFLEFHILENMPNSTREQRLETEEKWLKIYFDNGNQCYNLCDRAISREGHGTKNQEETKQKKSAAAKNFWKNQTDEYKKEYRETRNKTLKSQEHKNIVSANSTKIWKNKERRKKYGQKIKEKWLDPSFRNKCIGNLQRRCVSIEQWSKDKSTLIAIWPSIKEAELSLKITNISRVLSGKSPSTGGFAWKYSNSDKSSLLEYLRIT